MRSEEKPEKDQWPDRLGFWFLLTFATIAIPALLCMGVVSLARRLF